MKVTLVGGPGDGQEYEAAGMTAIEYATDLVGVLRTEVYTPRRYLSPYPIAGWSLELEHEPSGVARARWAKRVWALPGWHAGIDLAGQKLIRALEVLMDARTNHDATACDRAAREVDGAVEELVRLTEPGHRRPSEVRCEAEPRSRPCSWPDCDCDCDCMVPWLDGAGQHSLGCRCIRRKDRR